MDWNIALDKEILISYPKITQIQTASCVYPIELETEVKKAVCAYDWDKVSQIMIDFQRSFLDGKIYIPKEIKECYVRFFVGSGWNCKKRLAVLIQRSLTLKSYLR